MSKTVQLLAAGIVPMAAGLIFNVLILSLPLPGFLLLLLSLAALILWGCLAFRLAERERNPIGQSALMCVIGLVALALLLYQELILGQYWGGLAGSGTQTYFLAVLPLASRLTTPLLGAALSVIPIWPIYITAWLLLFLTGCIGCLLKRRG